MQTALLAGETGEYISEADGGEADCFPDGTHGATYTLFNQELYIMDDGLQVFKWAVKAPHLGWTEVQPNS